MDSEQQNPRAGASEQQLLSRPYLPSPLPVPYREGKQAKSEGRGQGEVDIQKALAIEVARKDAREHERPEYNFDSLLFCGMNCFQKQGWPLQEPSLSTLGNIPLKHGFSLFSRFPYTPQLTRLLPRRAVPALPAALASLSQDPPLDPVPFF